jgi:hypothetical protein
MDGAGDRGYASIMCWSPGADAVAGGVVASIGVVTLLGARRGRDRVLGSLPLLLGVHQLIEAVVWLDTQGRVSAGWGRAAVYAWAVIAFVVLPTLVPAGVLVADWPRGRLRSGVCLAVGVVVSVAMAVQIGVRGVTASAHGHVLDYGIGVVTGAGLALIGGYLVATLLAPLLSGDRFLRWFGVVATVGAAGCAAAWRLAFASTWCAFAAVLSVLLLAWVRRDRGRPDASGGSGDGVRAAERDGRVQAG